MCIKLQLIKRIRSVNGKSGWGDRKVGIGVFPDDHDIGNTYYQLVNQLVVWYFYSLDRPPNSCNYD